MKIQWQVFAFSLLLISSGLKAQNCLPGGIELRWQTEVDNFQNNFPGCVSVGGVVVINGGDISNLNGLQSLHSVGGLVIAKTNAFSLSLNGLANLRNVWGNFIINDLPGKTIQLPTFSSLSTIGGTLLIEHSGPVVGTNWFTGLEYLGGNLVIHSTSMLQVRGFCRLLRINGDLFIDNNSNLFELSINGVREVFGRMVLSRNPGLQNVVFPGGPTIIGGDFVLFELPSLSNMNFANRVEFIGGDLRITGLRLSQFNIGKVDIVENLILADNPFLDDLSNFQHFRYVLSKIVVENNPSLTSISSLDNIDPTILSEIILKNNSSLEFCNTNLVCNFLEAGGLLIAENNPGNCSSPENIYANCISGITNTNSGVHYNIYPNPSPGIISIETKNSQDGTVLIRDLPGSLKKTVHWDGIEGLDLSELPAGTYLLTVITAGYSETQPIILIE